MESLTTVPPGEVLTVYTYAPGDGYRLVDAGRIAPGRGFWMLVAASCRVRIR